MERKTVFLTDDDITNLNAGKSALSELYKVATFSSGALLLRALEKMLPDLILLDVEMPEMDGYETIRAIKARDGAKRVPVIFLTAKNDPFSEMEGLALGAVDYIFKPFSAPLLLKRIEIHLLLESQRKELVNFNNNLQEMVEARTQTAVELKNCLLQTMAEFVEYRDDITGGHIIRTQKYLNALLDALASGGAYQNEARAWDKELILQSAQLHDVGKIVVKDSVLQKPGKLTPEEFEQIKRHTTVGEQIISRVKERTADHAFLEYARVLAVSHHEKWDGTGYPNALAGTEIPLLGRFMTIADVYDALVSARPYKEPFSHAEAVDIITKSAGTHFDPALVDLFLKISDEFEKIAAAYTGE